MPLSRFLQEASFLTAGVYEADASISLSSSYRWFQPSPPNYKNSRLREESSHIFEQISTPVSSWWLNLNRRNQIFIFLQKYQVNLIRYSSIYLKILRWMSASSSRGWRINIKNVILKIQFEFPKSVWSILRPLFQRKLCLLTMSVHKFI